MKNTKISFDNLPEAVGLLLEKLDKIEKKLEEQTIPQTPKTKKQLLSVREAAELLNLAVPTVYSMVSRGALPYMKRSKHLYFDRDELIAYIRDGRQSTSAEVGAKAVYEFKAGRG